MLHRSLFIGLLLLLALAACTGAPAPTPTPEATPQVVTATFLPPTLTPIYVVVTNTPTITATATDFDLGIIASPWPTSEDLGMLPTATHTAPPVPLLATSTPVQALLPTSISAASATPFATAASLPTNEIPVIEATAVALVPAAQVCATCDFLRLRTTPGSSGTILDYLDANTPLGLVGRTDDNVWLQVTTPGGYTGWVSASFVDVTADLAQVAVTGEVEDTATTGTTNDDISPGSVVLPDTSQVVTNLTSRSRQIFLDGQAKGNIFNVFSVVGDSITATGVFMTRMTAGRYNLAGYSNLQPAVNWWSSIDGRGNLNFDPPLLAAYPGWSTFDVLDPDKALPGCAPGETPLHCEYRLVRPSVALIMLGTNDSGGVTEADYEANLRRIIRVSINMGVIPVLSTLPPRLDNGVNDSIIDAYNNIIIRLAGEYSIPLWNYRLAIDGLPNQGMSADMVHPSVPPDERTTTFDAYHLRYGYTVRNLTALQMLDQLWRQVLYDGGSVPTGEPNNDPVVVATNRPAQPTTVPAAPTAESGYFCPGAPTPRLTVGQLARVTPGLPNKYRAQPALGAAEVGSIPGEAQFRVVGGPTCADGFTWWQVDYQGVTGWTASGTASEYWVAP